MDVSISLESGGCFALIENEIIVVISVKFFFKSLFNECNEIEI